MWSSWSAIANVGPPISISEMICAGSIEPCSFSRSLITASVIEPWPWLPRIGIPLTIAMSTASPVEWALTLPDVVMMLWPHLSDVSVSR